MFTFPTRVSPEPQNNPAKIPVTVLTGFLGSGKTTLLNRLVTAPHGLRLAVIVNEVGEVGIDHELLVSAEQEVFQMSNGCLCCTVHGDLIRSLLQLLDEKARFDALVLETSGLAEPTTVIQTFLWDARIQSHFQLNAVVTMVDAFHVEQQLRAHHEARGQIALADTVVINKIDLVNSEELEVLERKIRRLNTTAEILQTKGADIEWSRFFNATTPALEGILGSSQIPSTPATHEHDPEIETVSIVEEGELDKTKLSQWFRTVLAENGERLLRMKGILNVWGEPHQLVFHGVHTLFEGRLGREWEKGQKRFNRLVFIGRDLPRDDLLEGFQGCLVSGDGVGCGGDIDVNDAISPLTLEQIQYWVRQILEFPSDTPVTIKEVPCVKPECPPIETAIMVWLKNEPPRFYKIQRTIKEVTFDNVYDLIENPMPCC